MKDNEQIDNLIEILERVKRCDNAVSNIASASLNMLFYDDTFEETDERRKWQQHVKELLREAMILILEKK
jgi:hypothetical protein